jgi:hypothetical protein
MRASFHLDRVLMPALHLRRMLAVFEKRIDTNLVVPVVLTGKVDNLPNPLKSIDLPMCLIF